MKIEDFKQITPEMIKTAERLFNDECCSNNMPCRLCPFADINYKNYKQDQDCGDVFKNITLAAKNFLELATEQKHIQQLKELDEDILIPYIIQVYGAKAIIEYIGKKETAELVIDTAYDILKARHDESQTEWLLERYKERGE